MPEVVEEDIFFVRGILGRMDLETGAVAETSVLL